MNQAVGVQALGGRRHAFGPGSVGVEQPCDLEDQETPQPLAAAQNRVAHGRRQFGLARIAHGWRKAQIQHALDAPSRSCQCLAEV